MTQVPPPLSERQSPLANCLRAAAIVLAVLFVYWPSLAGEFVYDDLQIIQQNPQISSFANLPQLFGSAYWDFLDQESASHVGYYRPLTMVLLTAGYVFGNAEPLAFHALSLVVYALACLAAWRFAVRLVRSEVIGFGAALLFALHPLHVESVAWISALHDPLFALFGFLSLNHYLKWRDSGSVGMPWTAGILFLLALLSKDAAVALLPIAVALDLGRRAAKSEPGAALIARPLQAYAPFLVMFAGYYGLRVIVFGDVLAGFDRTTTDFGVGAGRLALLRIELLGGAAKLLAWPAELNLFRPFQPELSLSSSSFITGVVGSIVLLAALGVAAWRRARPQLAMLLFIPAGIAPVLLRVESLGTFPLSDRFLFVPALGFTTFLAWVLMTRLPAKLGYGLIAIIALAYGLRTNAQLSAWQNEEAMFRASIVQNPRNPNVFWGLGRVLLSKYQEEGQGADLREAHQNFDAAMDLLEEAGSTGTDIYATHDDHLQANLGLGWCMLYEAQFDAFHDYETARVVFDRVIEYMPNSERGWIGKGVAWLFEGDPNQASEALRRAIQLNDLSPEAHYNMGLLLMRIEEFDAAALEFRRSAELRNDSFADLDLLARALQEAGKNDEAASIARRMLERFPEEPDPMIILGIAAAKAGRHGEAVEWFDRAIAVREYHGAAHLHRGKSLAALGQKNSAAKSLQVACELLPGSFEAHYNLSALLLESDVPETAVPYFMTAYQLRPRGELDIRLTKAAEVIHDGDTKLLTILATIDADRGDVDLAEAWARIALEIDPNHAPCQFILGMLLKGKKQFVEAYDLLRAAADALPDSYETQMEFGEVLLQTNQMLAAEPYFRRALALLPKQVALSQQERKKNGEVIRTALEEIEKLKLQGPPAPPAEQ